MLKQEITYLGVDGVERTEDFWFHFNAAELQEWNLRYGATLGEQLTSAIKEENWDLVVDTLKRMIVGSYGRKSPDGRAFVKTEALTNNFLGTEAYSQLFLQLTSDREFAINFTNGVVPQDIAAGQAQLGFRKPSQNQQPPMNRAERRAQPQDYRRPQQSQRFTPPVIQQDPQASTQSLNDQVYQENMRDNTIPEDVEQQPESEAGPQQAHVGYVGDGEQAEATRRGMSIEEYRGWMAWQASEKAAGR